MSKPSFHCLDIFGTTNKCLTLHDIQTLFKKETVETQVHCSSQVIKEDPTPRWSGVLLRQLLYHTHDREAFEKLKGLNGDKCRIIAESIDGMQGMVPCDRAVRSDSKYLVAYEKNGKPIPGHNVVPFRLVSPGDMDVEFTKKVVKISVEYD